MSHLRRNSRGGSKTRLIIEPENSRFKDSAAPHRYNTRLSARFLVEDDFNHSPYSNGSADSTILSVANISDMSLRTGVNSAHSTHLNPCSEPSFFSPGRFTKYSFIFMVICAIAIFAQQFFEKYHKTIDLESDLADVKTLMSEMKTNMESILKAREETSKVIDDIDQLFHKLETCDMENQKKSLKPERLVEGCDENVEFAVQSVLDKFGADKTGLPDFALESSGGEIIAIPNTFNYNTDESVTLFGWKLCSNTRGPSLIIQPNAMPGQCWAFKGNTGSVIIKLISEIMVTAVTIEHIPKQISPSNDISSAPKDFVLFGVDHHSEINLGRFTYDSNGDPVQTFPIPAAENKKSFSLVRFDFLSNHGNPLYTCVYRVRVHGNIQNDSNNRASVNSL